MKSLALTELFIKVQLYIFTAQIPQKLQDAINNGTLFLRGAGLALIVVFLVWAGITYAAKKDIAELKVQIIGIVVGTGIIILAEELSTLLVGWFGM